MKAVIMAGGEGTRLRPLTCDCPKPMTRLCGRPVLEYILDLLLRHGVTEAAVTLRYLPGMVREQFPGREYGGMKLRFLEEESPLGTAGSVKNAAAQLNEDFIVISGDALCDFDLMAAMKFHREKRAAATLLLSHVRDPREYGLVVTGPDSLVHGFVEKPGWAQAVTDAVNTGIYILSPSCLPLIPDGEAFDFAKDLFPLMLRQSLPVYGFEADGYWCDIGDVDAYLAAQFDLLEGRVECRLPGFKQGQERYKAARPTGVWRAVGPVYVGDGVRIGEGAVIGPFVVLDDGCTVGTGVTVKNSVLLPGAYVGDNCELRGALLCPGASLKRGAAMFEGSVAGAGSVIGEDAAVSPGVRIWPGKTVEDGARAAVNLKSGDAHRALFGDEGITGEVGVELTTEQCARIGAATGGAYSRGTVGLACDGTPAAQALLRALIAGVLSAGAQACDFGGCLESLFRFSVSRCRLDAGIFVRCAGGTATLSFAGSDGLGLSRAAERRIETAVRLGELPRCRPAEYREPRRMQGFDLLYRQELLNAAGGILYGVGAIARSSNPQAQSLLSEVLALAGCREDGIHAHLDVSGRQVAFFDENGAYIDADRALALGCLSAFEEGQDVALPCDAPAVLESMAQEHARRVLRYLSCPADASDREARTLAARQPFVRDGLFLTVRILRYLRQNALTLSQAARRLPAFAVAHRAMPVTGNPGVLLRRLAGGQALTQDDAPAEGVRIAAEGGSVFVTPLRRGDGLRILAEAGSMEMADELCANFEKKLQKDDMLDRTGQ